MERKLTAILSADVEGYSRLMGDDEEATVRTLSEYREAMSRLIEEHKGRVIDSPGDNLLAEFTSAVNAVRCAVVIQGELRARNVDLPEDRRMNYRIGINLGDVIVDGERIYGDGVNIAARVESLAEGGSISVSGTVYDQVANKLSYAFDNQGDHTVKNIAEPVRVYAVRWDVEKTAAGKNKPAKRGVWIAAVVIVAVFVVISIGVIFWDKVKTLEKPTVEETTPPPVSEIPSIAVLPFRDMSPEKDQEYFCEGIAEELLNAFTKVAGLRVAARTSSFRFKDEAVSTIGKLLNVTTVLEGSVRKDGNNLRITAQLINVTDGFHLWSDTYDRELKNIFAIQDEISQAIAKALHLTLSGEETASLVKTNTKNSEAYDHYLLGRYLWNKRAEGTDQSEEAYKVAIEHFKEAVALDPDFALAYSGLADAYTMSYYVRGVDSSVIVPLAKEAAAKALELGPELAEAHTSYGLSIMYDGDTKLYLPNPEIERVFKRAIELNPNYAIAHHFLRNIFFFSGRMDEAIDSARKALELEPFLLLYNRDLGESLLRARQHNAAIEQLQRTLEIYPAVAGSSTLPILFEAFLFENRFEEAERTILRWAELTGKSKEGEDAIRLFVSLVKEHARTGEPIFIPADFESVLRANEFFYPAVFVYSLLGQKEKAFELLEQYYDGGKRVPWMALRYQYFDSIRSEPRFIALMQKVGLVEEE